MKFRLNRDSEFPIYQQLKEQIRYFLLSGALQPGTKVPTPKDLGTYLRINRNTVIAAYKELEKEGLLVTKQGQGTYIPEKLPSLPDQESKEALLALAEETIEKTKKLGFNPEDLFTIIFNHTVLGIGTSNKTDLRALLVECNLPDLQYFQQTLEKELEIKIDICLLSELENRISEDNVVKADFVVTSFIHIEDVKATLESLSKEVVAIMAAPHLHVYMRIAQLTPGSRVGIICGTDKGAYNMRRALEEAGVEHISITNCCVSNQNSVKELLSQVDWVVCSRASIQEVQNIAPSGVQFIEFFNELDHAGIEMLKQYIVKIKNNKSKEVK